MNRIKQCLLLLLLAIAVPSSAQLLNGVVKDAETGDSIGFASIVYEGHRISAIANALGQFQIARHEGWNVTFSAVGYKSRIVRISDKTKSRLNITLKPDKRQLQEVTVKSNRSRYSRKDNQAVELMRRVVAAKRKNDLSTNDFYQYNKYEKITLALNDLKPEQLEAKPFSNHPWLLDQIETSPHTGTLILLMRPSRKKFTGVTPNQRRPLSPANNRRVSTTYSRQARL